MAGSEASSPAKIVVIFVSVVISVFVAYWMLGLGNSFTRFGTLEFTSACAVRLDTTCEIRMTVKNTGTTNLLLDQVFLNGKPVETHAANGTSNTKLAWNTVTLEPGQETHGSIFLIGSQWSMGMNIEVTIRTSDGRNYPKLVILP